MVEDGDGDGRVDAAEAEGLPDSTAASSPFPNNLFRTSTGSGPAYAVVDCFRAEPLTFRDEARKEELEVEESLETKEREEALGDIPGRCCDVI